MSVTYYAFTSDFSGASGSVIVPLLGYGTLVSGGPHPSCQ